MTFLRLPASLDINILSKKFLISSLCLLFFGQAYASEQWIPQDESANVPAQTASPSLMTASVQTTISNGRTPNRQIPNKTANSLLLLIGFTNIQITTPESHWHNIIFGENQNSLRDYY